MQIGENKNLMHLLNKITMLLSCIPRKQKFPTTFFCLISLRNQFYKQYIFYKMDKNIALDPVQQSSSFISILHTKIQIINQIPCSLKPTPSTKTHHDISATRVLLKIKSIPQE
jgi:hypothetical protein